MQPYDYSLNLPDPTQTFMQYLQIGQHLKQQQQQQALQQRRSEVYGRLGPQSTYQDYMAAIRELPEDAEALLGTWQAMGEAKSKAMFDAGGQAWASLQPGEDGNIDPTRALEKLEEYAAGFENSGDEEIAKQLRDAAKAIEINPATGRTVLGTLLAMADGERFKNIAQTSEATPFQKDFSFIKETFGEDAAAEFAQYGRGGVVSIPLGNGQTYVGPASSAPGATRWQQQGGQSAPEILGKAAGTKTITEAEAGVIRQSLGPNGQAKFNEWLANNKIKVIQRTGTDADGRKVIQYTDGSWSYGD